MKLHHIALTIFICIIWGLNFVIGKNAVMYFPTFFMLAVRLTLVGIILLPFIKKPEVPFKDLVQIAVIFTVLHFGAMFLALEKGLDSSVAVVVDQMRVPFAVALGYFLLNEKVGRKAVLGIAIAITGTFVIVGTPNVVENYPAFWMLIFSAASWAVYNIKIKNMREIDPISFIGWMSIIGAPMLYIISFIYEGNNFHLLVDAPIDAYASLLYIAFAATIFAHGIWYYLLKRYDVGKIVPYSLLVPVFGIAAGVIFANEQLTVNVIIGAFLTIMGVAIVFIKNPRSGLAGEEI